MLSKFVTPLLNFSLKWCHATSRKFRSLYSGEVLYGCPLRKANPFCGNVHLPRLFFSTWRWHSELGTRILSHPIYLPFFSLLSPFDTFPPKKEIRVQVSLETCISGVEYHRSPVQQSPLIGGGWVCGIVVHQKDSHVCSPHPPYLFSENAALILGKVGFLNTSVSKSRFLFLA